MVGLVIATHGNLARELVTTAEQIVGPLPNVATCSIDAGISLDDIKDQMRSAVSSVCSAEGVIVLADLVGGTPCNQSLSLCGTHHLEVLTGVNLPMLLKANSLRKEALPLAEMANALASYGQKNILCMSERLRDAGASNNH